MIDEVLDVKVEEKEENFVVNHEEKKESTLL
jgi:hypothetical protein